MILLNITENQTLDLKLDCACSFNIQKAKAFKINPYFRTAQFDKQLDPNSIPHIKVNAIVNVLIPPDSENPTLVITDTSMSETTLKNYLVCYRTTMI